MDAYQFWVKVFALTFALGVVSGVTMSFQFGTNWPGFMNTVGNVAGPLLAYEVLTAFFLEATMLGIMLFGRERVSERVHTTATFLVAAGTTASAFWILALNSWMQTPAGFEMIDGQAHVTSWWAVIFNPSFPYRLTHMLLASGLTVAFLLAGLSAYRWLRQDRGADVRARCAPACAGSGRADPAADRGGRPARAQHPAAPAGQDRRDGGHLAEFKGLNEFPECPSAGRARVLRVSASWWASAC
jgi:cytochrome bd-type quinol oxidase subunit 1